MILPTISLQPIILEDADLLLEFMKEFYEHEKLVFKPSYILPVFQKLISDPNLGRGWRKRRLQS